MPRLSNFGAITYSPGIKLFEFARAKPPRSPRFCLPGDFSAFFAALQEILLVRKMRPAQLGSGSWKRMPGIGEGLGWFLRIRMLGFIAFNPTYDNRRNAQGKRNQP